VKKVFFASRLFPFHLLIYPGSGPGFASAYGWQAEPIDRIGSTDFDIAIIENRLLEEDVATLETFFATAPRARPVFFKMSDPEMPRSRNPGVRYILGKADQPDVHYVSVYRPAGPLAEFFARLRRSRVATAPFPYEPGREIDVPLDRRSRRVFLSGARNRRVYPLRESLYRRATWSPWTRGLLDRLAHPGYPDTGKPARHDITHDRYVARAATSTHFFLDPSRYRVELMKFLECAYAGCVPIGALPSTLEEIVESHFLSSQGRWADLRDATRMPEEQIRGLASGYRAAMRRERDAALLDAALDSQVHDLL
jgi:hypothetical protein